MTTTAEANREAATRMRRHHAAMMQATRDRVSALADAAPDGAAWQAARDDLAAYVRDEILPHAQVEETTIYALAGTRPSLAALIEAMTLEHRSIADLYRALAGGASKDAALIAGAGLSALFATHAGIENDVILVRLEDDPEASLGDVLAQMHEALQGSKDGAAVEDVELDVRTVPHAQRHAMIFGLVQHLKARQALVLTVDHDPLPLRYQLQSQYGERLQWVYRAEGPREWSVAISVAD